ncbi:hypothetical protein ACNAW0_19230 [Micromonospora sp. SL1-18]|uniref:hypothetical protein n=1 Tax=Micromonospora sp. SL1-18 TaxID=3399128 RepID=UPI003A4DA35C
MTQPKTNRVPAPFYAAAGAGELALRQLRKLPAVVGALGTRVVADLGGKAVLTGVELRHKATETLKTANLTATGLRERASAADFDLDKLREAAALDKLREAATLDKFRAAAGRNAAAMLAGAQSAQERALTGAQAAQARAERAVVDAQERALAAYAELVARGERVVGAGVLQAADTVNADIEATEADHTPVAGAAQPVAEAALPAEVPSPAEVAEVVEAVEVVEVEAKPAAVKRTRATKATTTKAATTKAASTKAASAKAASAKPATPSAKLPKTTKRTRPAAE